MKTSKLGLLIINLVGGAAVICSYIWGFLSNPGGVEAFWGGVPAVIRTAITINMLLAATGYLVIFLILLLRVPSTTTVGKLPFWTFHVIYLVILIPSAMWMPLTKAVIQHYTPVGWFSVVLVLALTALAGIAMLIALLSLRPALAARQKILAVIGSTFFILQTTVLDAILWTLFFRP
jgi:hypothetical protein